jgi:HPt (histidine-containing phosphotransfer) domain-containing protein
MGSTRRRPRIPANPAAPAAAQSAVLTDAAQGVAMRATTPIDKDDSFENLRQAFHARMESERVHFVTLSAALARAEENPLPLFEDLVYRAHRLQGGAAIFEESEVARAAGKLENAAVVAAQSRADNTDEGVWAALEALVKLMGNLESARGMARA